MRAGAGAEGGDLAATIGARLVAEARERLAAAPRVSGADSIRVEVPGAEEAGFVVALVETIVPPPHLFVCGAGRDALPVMALAELLGWAVTVYDPRGKWPGRDAAGAPSHPRMARSLPALEAAVRGAASRAVTVVMSHGYETDRALVGALLSAGAPYIGVLGPRRRTEKILAELAQGGAIIGDAETRRIFAPVGLAIGAETPEEIALAIVAEAQAALAGGRGGFLRDHAGPIHAASGANAALPRASARSRHDALVTG